MRKSLESPPQTNSRSKRLCKWNQVFHFRVPSGASVESSGVNFTSLSLSCLPRPPECQVPAVELVGSIPKLIRSNGHGSKSRFSPPVNIPIPTKIKPKMGGEFTYQPKWDLKTVLTTTAESTSTPRKIETSAPRWPRNSTQPALPLLALRAAAPGAPAPARPRVSRGLWLLGRLGTAVRL